MFVYKLHINEEPVRHELIYIIPSKKEKYLFEKSVKLCIMIQIAKIGIKSDESKKNFKINFTHIKANFRPNNFFLLTLKYYKTDYRDKNVQN